MTDIQYADDMDIAIFDGKTFRRDKKTGYYLSSKSVKNGKRQRLHIYVWEKYNGDIPEGFHIHHKDFDKTNNEINNLIALSKAEHLSIHAKAMTEDRKDSLRKQLKEKAVPKSKEWHKSEDGRKWHSEHLKKQWEDWEPKKYECTNCGETFESINRYSEKSNRFCSNKCKSAYRRKMGYDNEERVCSICGKPFAIDKYSKRKRCFDCFSG